MLFLTRWSKRNRNDDENYQEGFSPDFSVINSSSLNKGNHYSGGLWISDFNQLGFLPFVFHFFSVWLQLRRYIKHSRKCLTTFPNIRKFVKNTPLCVVLLTIFSVFKCDQAHSFVFDIVVKSFSFTYKHPELIQSFKDLSLTHINLRRVANLWSNVKCFKHCFLHLIVTLNVLI